ncbi:MAG: CotH kinase family protein [Oscillospiraceae bacterium]|nr:CotH kinase family protein [Oscillospiraceae bacterium]MBQ4310614.1 CotH kinase family protein [Oscillospiraceae bacterium]
MHDFRKIIAAAALITILCGCAGNSPETPANTDAAAANTDAAASASADTNPPAETEDVPAKRESTMPLISITTKKQTPDALDFVNLPVAAHVSEAIASWTPGYVMPPAPWYEDCTVSVTGTDGSTLLTGADAKVKVRGNWTTTYDKKPLRIKFSEKQEMLGLNGGNKFKDWVLLAEYKDGSMQRNKTIYDVSRDILGAEGLYAPDCEFVEVEINGDYRGVYLLTEQQQVRKNRVNITDVEQGYTGTDIGYFLEMDTYFYTEDELQQFRCEYHGNDPLTPFDGKGGSGRTIKFLPGDADFWKSDVGFTIKSDINSWEQHDLIEAFVNGVYDIMYEAAYNKKAYRFNDGYTGITEAPDITPEEAVRAVADVDSLAAIYIINELACDADIYCSSFYMTADLGAEGNKKLTFQAPWDFDSAMGVKSRCPDGTGFYAGNIVPDVNGNYETVNPWLTVLMYEDWYQDIIREKWTAAYDSGIFSRALGSIEADRTLHHDAFERNYVRWNNIINNEIFVNELSDRAKQYKDHDDAADHFYEWFGTRIDFINEQWHK